MMPDRRTILTGAIALTLEPTWSTLAMSPDLSVFELRQYTLRRGRRDELIALFEGNFIESQNAVGAPVLGTFRDAEDPDRFVWLRGFQDMPARKAALEAFYGGAVWKSHSAAANATMLDSDNVLLLRPATFGAGLGPLQDRATGGVIRVAIHALRDVDPAAFTAFFDRAIAPRVSAEGAAVIGRFVTETVPNNFPRLPIREHEPVFVWLARLSDPDTERRFTSALNGESGWRDGAPERLLPAFMSKPEVLRLIPTARSSLR